MVGASPTPAAGCVYVRCKSSPTTESLYYIRWKEVHLMSSKLSEIQSRRTKVKKLKEKIQKEVTELRTSLQLYPHSEDKTQIIELSYLYAIEDYINDESSFMHYYFYDEPMDVISYIIDDETIDMMTLNSFSFVHNVIFELEKQSGLCRYDVCSILNDNFVSQGLMTITESIVLRDKLRKA